MILSKENYLESSISILSDWLSKIEKLERKLRTSHIQVIDNDKLEFVDHRHQAYQSITPTLLKSGRKHKKQLTKLFKLMQTAKHKLHNQQDEDILNSIVNTIKTYNPAFDMLDKIETKIRNHRPAVDMPGFYADNPIIDYKEKKESLVSKDTILIFDNLIETFEIILDDEKISKDYQKDIQKKKKETLKQREINDIEKFNKKIIDNFNDIDF